MNRIKILVDADACPVSVRDTVLKIASAKKIEVIMFVDVNHNISDGYSRVVVVEQGSDSVDFRLISEIRPGDVVVTQDYGVAAIALAKRAKVVHPSGMIFSDNNIEGLLNNRFIKQKMRRQGKYPKSRTRNLQGNGKSFFEILNGLVEG